MDTRDSALSIVRDHNHNRNRDCNRVVETRVVDHNSVGDNRDGTVSVICNRVVDTQDGTAIGFRIRLLSST